MLRLKTARQLAASARPACEQQGGAGGMNRVIDDPDQVTEDSIRGVLAAHPDLLAATEHPRVLRRAGDKPKNRVGIVTGGGPRPEPGVLGYVGPRPLRHRR